MKKVWQTDGRTDGETEWSQLENANVVALLPRRSVNLLDYIFSAANFTGCPYLSVNDHYYRHISSRALKIKSCLNADFGCVTACQKLPIFSDKDLKSECAGNLAWRCALGVSRVITVKLGSCMMGACLAWPPHSSVIVSGRTPLDCQRPAPPGLRTQTRRACASGWHGTKAQQWESSGGISSITGMWLWLPAHYGISSYCTYNCVLRMPHSAGSGWHWTHMAWVLKASLPGEYTGI